MLKFAIDGITSFSINPLRLATHLGIACALIGFLGVIYAILENLFFPKHLVVGWTSIFIAIMFIGGIQLITTGILGEYIGKIYIEIKKRPEYIIRVVAK